jgi:hypothetical protein
MLESQFEQRWCKKAALKGWLCIKNIHLSINGIPDRTLLKDGKILFVEFKAKKGRLSEIQKYRIEQLRKMKFHVLIIFAPE